jgi:hypothetical protein
MAAAQQMYAPEGFTVARNAATSGVTRGTVIHAPRPRRAPASFPVTRHTGHGGVIRLADVGDLDPSPIELLHAARAVP